MPHPTTFKSLAEPTYGIMRKAAFLMALDQWAHNPKAIFDRIKPPVDALADETSDENSTLAAVFCRLAKQENLTGQIALIQLEIFHHQRLFGLAWDHAQGETDPRRRPQRATYFELRPYEQMIHTLENWAEALHQKACEETP